MIWLETVKIDNIQIRFPNLTRILRAYQEWDQEPETRSWMLNQGIPQRAALFKRGGTGMSSSDFVMLLI